MNANLRRGVLAAAGLGAIAATYGAYRTLYASARDEADARIGSLTAEIGALEEEAGDAPATLKRLKEISSRTLGVKADVVDQRFRDLLWAVAQQAGLGDAVVNCGEPRPEASPMLSERSVPASFKKALRARPDFFLVRGTIQGQGTLDQAVNTIAILQAQPWVHRVEGFSLEPKGKQRELIDLKVNVATIFLPDLPGPSAAPALVPTSPDVDAVWHKIASANVFREPPPPPAPPSVPAPAPVVAASAPAPAPSPYAEWRITAVVRGRTGTQAWLLNMRTSERVFLGTGERVLDAVFVDGLGDRAVFDVAGKRMEFTINDTLVNGRSVP